MRLPFWNYILYMRLNDVLFSYRTQLFIDKKIQQIIVDPSF